MSVKRIIFSLNEPFDINYIKNIYNKYPNSKILVEIQNTKGISSSMIRQLNSKVLIRIAGGYDEDRLKRYAKIHRLTNYYQASVIYTRNETIKILEEIEKIESGINKNWSAIQKLLYIYDKLKTEIMYSPKYKSKSSAEIRSLRGLITKQTVCAGYSLMLKEFMDRNDIECEYVEGIVEGNNTGGHAWNIVTIDNKKYPIDLTWDNTKFRLGSFNSFDWLGQDIANFNKYHHPAIGEKTQDYEHTLSQLDPEFIKLIYFQIGIGRERNFYTTTYEGIRKDNSHFILAQIGDIKINKAIYYRYYYVEITKDGKKKFPLILYSETNITHLINSKKFKKPIPPNYEEAICNILFSRENILNSINKHTNYIGKIRKNSKNNKFKLVSSYSEIVKPKEKTNLFFYPIRRGTRSDGSTFIAQQMSEKPHKINGIDVIRYDIFEIINENGKEILKRNTVFTEKNLFKDNRQSTIDDYLSRERLDRKAKETGGYIGYYNKKGIIVENPELIKFFQTSKRINIDSSNEKSKKYNTQLIQIPSFTELKNLASKYEIYLDQKDSIHPNTSNIKIRDIKTGQIQNDKSIISKAIFANIWLFSAGIKISNNEHRPGESYAFNKSAEKLYYIICTKLLNECKVKGVIDTVELLQNIDDKNYKYNRQIITNLFSSPYQTEMINKFFLQSLGINKLTEHPKSLHDTNNENKLIFNNKNKRR